MECGAGRFLVSILAPWWRGRWDSVLLFMPVAVVALVSRLRGAAMRNRERNLLRLVEKRTAELKEANEHLIRLSVEHEKNLAEEQRAHAEEVAQLNRRAIEMLALAIEAKDETTGDHLQRVEVYAIEIAKEMGLDQAGIEALRAAALLHDVGKLAVPDYIISKPGRLTPEEFEKMKAHTGGGRGDCGADPVSVSGSPAVRSHHEKWDGTGYPDGLSGDRIPIGARILAAVDCLERLPATGNIAGPYRVPKPLRLCRRRPERALTRWSWRSWRAVTSNSNRWRGTADRPNGSDC